jgi:hypothetical protein
MKTQDPIRIPSYGTIILTVLAVSISALAPLGQSCRSETIGPWGSYSNRVTEAALQNPFVRGVMVSVSWRQIQRSSKEAFNWSKVDEQIDNATSAGKDVTLVLQAGGQNTPDWVKDTQGVQLITIIDTSNIYNDTTYCKPVTIPVFWDPIFLELKKKFIVEAGKRYGANTSISGVMVSFANFITSDWNVPHDIDYTGQKCGMKFNQIRDWKNAGYSTEKMFAAGKETIDAWAEAFPGKALKLPIHPTHKNLEDSKDGTPATGSKLAEKIIQYGYEAYPERFYAQLNTLNAKTPRATQSRIIKADPNKDDYILKILKDHPNRIGFQLLSAASNGYYDACRLNSNIVPCHPYTVLMNSVRAAFSYKPRYIEFWCEDAENSGLYRIFREVNSKLEQF